MGYGVWLLKDLSLSSSVLTELIAYVKKSVVFCLVDKFEVLKRISIVCVLCKSAFVLTWTVVMCNIFSKLFQYEESRYLKSLLVSHRLTILITPLIIFEYMLFSITSPYFNNMFHPFRELLIIKLLYEGKKWTNIIIVDVGISKRSHNTC